MALDLETLVIQLATESAEYVKGLEQANQQAKSWASSIQSTAQQGFSGLQSFVKGGLLGAVGIAGAGLAGLAVEMSDSIELARIQRDAEKQLAAVLESTGHAAGLTADELKAMAGELQGVTNFGDEATIAGQSLLLTFTNIGKDTFPRATEAMLDMSTVFGQDLKSSAIQLGKALNDPITGVSALSRVGVSFTEEQKEMIKTMAEAGDIAGAQAVILSELERQVGGSARAMADPAIQLGNAWGDFKEVVGGAVLPLLNDLQSQALPLVNEAISTATVFISSFFDVLGNSDSIIEGLKWALIDAFGEDTPWVQSIFNFGNIAQSFVSQLGTFLAPIANLITQFVSWKDVLVAVAVVAASIVLPALAGIVAGVAPVIAVGAALVGGIALLRKAWETDFGGMRTALTQFWESSVQPALSDAQGWLRDRLPGAIAVLTSYWENQLLPALQTVWAFIDQNVIPLIGALANVWFAVLQVQIATLRAVFENVLLPILRTVWGYIRDNIIPIFGGMNDSIGGISGTIRTVIGWLGNLADRLNSVANRIPDLFRPGSPTPFEIGFRGIADGIDEARRAGSRLSFDVGARLSPAVSAATSGLSSGTTNNNLVINITANDAITAGDSVIQSLRSYGLVA